MKKKLNTYEIVNALLADTNAAWSYYGAFAIAEHLEQYEESTGEELELDIVAIRSDYSEYASLRDWASEHFSGESQAADELGLEVDMDGVTFINAEEQIEESIRKYIQHRGDLIEFEGGIIVSNF